MEEAEIRKHPLIVELVGRSGVGKSFLYNKLKNELNNEDQYLFTDYTGYKYIFLFNLRLFFDSVLTINCCSLKKGYFLKYLKRWYWTQLLIKNKRNNQGKSFVIIDEGPFQILRSIKRFGKGSLNKVRSCVFKHSKYLPDVVILVGADWDVIYKRKLIKKHDRGKDTYLTVSNGKRKDIGLQMTKEDISHACKFKKINIIEINNADDNLDFNVKTIIDQLNKIRSNAEDVNRQLTRGQQ